MKFEDYLINEGLINKIRSVLYKSAKILGDVNAVASGRPDKIVKRIGRRIVGKVTQKAMNRMFK